MGNWTGALPTIDLDLATDLSVLFLTFLAVVFAYIQVRNYVHAFGYHLYDTVGGTTGWWEPRIFARAVPDPSVNDDHSTELLLEDNELELVYLRIIFDPVSNLCIIFYPVCIVFRRLNILDSDNDDKWRSVVGSAAEFARSVWVFGLRFELLRWWIEVPEGFRVLRRGDVVSLSERDELPAPEETSLNTDAVRINPGKDATYDNLDFGYLESKHYVLKRNYVRGEVTYFGTKNNRRIHVPLWIHTPERYETDRSSRNESGAEEGQGYTVDVAVDPPQLPYKNTSEIDVLLLPTDDRVRLWARPHLHAEGLSHLLVRNET